MAKLKLDFSNTSEVLSMPVGIHLVTIESAEVEKNAEGTGKNLKVAFVNELGESKISYMPAQGNLFRLKSLLVALDLYDVDEDSNKMSLNTTDLVGDEVVIELKKGTQPVKDKDTGEVRKDKDGNTMFYTELVRIHSADYIGKLDEEEELDLDDDFDEEEEAPKEKAKKKAKPKKAAKKKKVEEPEDDEDDFEDLEDLDEDEEEEEVKPKKKGKKKPAAKKATKKKEPEPEEEDEEDEDFDLDDLEDLDFDDLD